MEREPKFEPAESSALEIVNKFGAEIEGNVVDVRDIDNEQVLELLSQLANTGKFVFHGTNSEAVYEILEARQANDSTKESGNKKAVYADEGTTAPIAAALWNRNYIRSKFRSTVTGWSNNEEGKMIFKFSPNLFELVKNKDENLYSDGFIYALDRSNFDNAEDAGAEWHAESDQKPVLAIKVSKKLADNVFSDDNVREYTPEEMKKIEGFNSTKK